MNWLDAISRFWPHLAAGFDFLAALLASAHALLHKRDTRAATLWIGFIWLLPLFGPIALSGARRQPHPPPRSCPSASIKPSAAPFPKTSANRNTKARNI